MIHLPYTFLEDAKGKPFLSFVGQDGGKLDAGKKIGEEWFLLHPSESLPLGQTTIMEACFLDNKENSYLHIGMFPHSYRHSWLENLNLPWEHRDPASRTIVALATPFNCPLVTSDNTIAGYYHKAIW